MYTAAVINLDDLAPLEKAMRQHIPFEEGYVCQTAQGNPLPHHMTINMGGFDTALNPKDILGQNCRMVIDSLYQDDDLGVAAARVIKAECELNETTEPICTINDGTSEKHITLCLKPGSKPFWSNKLFERRRPTTIVHQLDSPLVIEGVIQGVH